MQLNFLFYLSFKNLGKNIDLNCTNTAQYLGKNIWPTIPNKLEKDKKNLKMLVFWRTLNNQISGRSSSGKHFRTDLRIRWQPFGGECKDLINNIFQDFFSRNPPLQKNRLMFEKNRIGKWSRLNLNIFSWTDWSGCNNLLKQCQHYVCIWIYTKDFRFKEIWEALYFVVHPSVRVL